MYYKTHHDAGGGKRVKHLGTRVYTAFIYLNDIEEVPLG